MQNILQIKASWNRVRNEEEGFMKRLTRDQQLLLLGQRDRCQMKRARYTNRLRAKARRRSHGQPKRLNWVTVGAPVRLRYHGNRAWRDTFFEFIDRVEGHLSQGTGVCIDFGPTVQLYPCGMLLFLGHLDSWLTQAPGRLKCKYPEDDTVEQMLQSTNVLQRLGRLPRKEITHNDVIRWHRFEGQNVDATPMEPFMEEVRAAAGISLQMGLGDCVAEAMTNVKKHAYPEDSVSHGWWMFATINRQRGNVFVAMYDRGDSIPGTLLAKPELSDYLTLRTLHRYGADRELIAAAVGGRTRTRLPYRGKGLPEMLDFTRLSQATELAIYRRRGYYQCQPNRGVKTARTDTKGSLRRPVEGTLVIWGLEFAPDQP